MLTSNYAAVWTLAFLTQALAGKMEPALAPRAPTDAASTSVVLGTASGGALDPKATRPPTADQVDFSGDLLLNIVNKQGYALSIFYGSNAPPSISGNPGSGVLSASATTQVAVPTLFAGRVIIGPDYDVKASKIEWNWSNVPDVDLSGTMALLAPKSSPASATTLNGMFPPVPPMPSSHLAIPGAPLPQYIDLIESDTDPDQTNRGSAYTFPKDDGANAWNQCNSGVIDCCVGTSCPAPARQPKSKRELNDVEMRHANRQHARGEAE
ncbi:MAG: hypothetical protein ASARMPRED_001906 [Alectoria sarmentosa]|nr:MAG: hypothetical protein ASARMPRED_001906 [Alectoria sarmentosa]